MDDDGITVQRVFFVERTEGTDVINGETAPVRPGDGPGLHIAGVIKVGSDFYVNTVRHDTDTSIRNSAIAVTKILIGF